MIHVKYMKPYETRVTGDKVRLVFAYQYFTITKEDEAFHFIPIEGREIIVNLNTMQVENMSEVFVFQRGKEFIRLPLYQLLLVSNVHDHLTPILDGVEAKYSQQSKPQRKKSHKEEVFSDEITQLVNEIEQMNIKHLIDNALDNNDVELFTELTKMLNKVS